MGHPNVKSMDAATRETLEGIARGAQSQMLKRIAAEHGGPVLKRIK
jgi:hypothetical protein